MHKYPLAILYSVLFVCTSPVLFAQEKSVKTKSISKTITPKDCDTLIVENRYGSIFVNNWKKNEVEIVIKIVCTSKSEAQSQTFLNLVNVSEEINNSRTVMYKTRITTKDGKEKEVGSYNKLKEAYQYEIDSIPDIDSVIWETNVSYYINAPKGFPMKLANAFGNIQIEELENPVQLTIAWGRLAAKKIVNSKVTFTNLGSIGENRIDYIEASAINGTLSKPLFVSHAKATVFNGFQSGVVVDDAQAITINKMTVK